MSRLRLFLDDRDRERFLWLLNDHASRVGMRVLAYCLMDTHYHLLVEGTSGQLGALMHRLNGCYANQYNARHDHTGHVSASGIRSISSVTRSTSTGHSRTSRTTQ
jgi:REP element-mobilizing transposase RayT